MFRRQRIGFIFQNYNLVPVLNVYENIVMPIQLDGKKPDQKFIKEIVALLGLEKKLYNMPNTLSGGQQQRCHCKSFSQQTGNHPCRRADRQSGQQDQ